MFSEKREVENEKSTGSCAFFYCVLMGGKKEI